MIITNIIIYLNEEEVRVYKLKSKPSHNTIKVQKAQ